jgi:hypothetical protein
MALALADPHTDFIFGLAGNRALTPQAEPFLAAARNRIAVLSMSLGAWAGYSGECGIGCAGPLGLRLRSDAAAIQEVLSVAS